MEASCLTVLRYLHTSKNQQCPMPRPPTLPDITEEADKVTLFTLGDWGPTGNNPGCPYSDKGCASPCRFSMFANIDRIPDSCSTLFDRNNGAQQTVADQMAKAAQDTPPTAVINVGDNFYFGGLSTPLNFAAGVSADITMDYMLNTSFRGVYLENSNDPDGKLKVPFLGMLGNHDYGGAGCLADWQVQLEFSKIEKNWVMPYQYYKQRIQADGYFIDIFVNEINEDDCCGTDDHGICHQKLCAAPDYPTGTKADEQECMARAHTVFDRNKEWLEEELKQSKADGARWQIVAGHFSDGHALDEVKQMMISAGAHLYVGGHTHKQAWIPKGSSGSQGMDSILTGAGGGIEFEGQNDYYGFGAIDVSKDKLGIRMIGETGEVRSHGEVTHPSLVEVLVDSLV